MKKVRLLITIFILICLMASCQKTPDEPIVITKDKDTLLENAQVDNDESQGITLANLNAPDTLHLSIDGDKLSVTVDAKVYVPDADAMPIIRVEGGDFCQEQVTSLFNYLCKDTQMYAVPPVMTKDEIESEIITLKEALARAINAGDEGQQQILNDLIAQREKEFITAPEKVDKVLSDGTLYVVEEKHPYTKAIVGHYTALSVMGGDISFSVKNNSDRKEAISYVSESGGGGRPLRTDARLKYKNKIKKLSYGMYGKYLIDETSTVETQPLLANLKITPSEAVQMADRFLKDNNIPMTAQNVYIMSDERSDGGKYYAAENYMYEVECARVVDGVNCAIVDGEATGGKDMFTQSWFYEKLIFWIDDDGIMKIEWTSPLNIKDTVVDNCNLLSFDKVQETFIKMMPIVYEYEANEYETGDTYINIDKVELVLVRTSEQDSIKYGLLLPAWRFYGTKTQGDITARDCFLTINAVDGSVINTDIGY